MLTKVIFFHAHINYFIVYNQHFVKIIVNISLDIRLPLSNKFNKQTLNIYVLEYCYIKSVLNVFLLVDQFHILVLPARGYISFAHY